MNKEVEKEKRAKYREENKEKIKVRRRELYAINRDKKKALLTTQVIGRRPRETPDNFKPLISVSI